MPGRGDIGDLGGMEGREFRGGADFAGKIQMRGRAHAHDRDDIGQRIVGVHMAADDVEKINLASGRQVLGNGQSFLFRQALLPVLVGDHAHADDEFWPYRLADGSQHAARETQAVV